MENNVKIEVFSWVESKHYLRILASYEAKIAKICNFWAFWPVIHLRPWSVNSLDGGFFTSVTRKTWHTSVTQTDGLNIDALLHS